MANLFDQANERKKWDATIAQVGQMGYPQNPAQPPAFTSPQPRRPTSFGDAAAATSNPGVTQLPPSATQGSAPGPSTLYMQDRADELRTQVGAGNYAQAAGTAARTAVQGLGMYGIELADKLATPAINSAASFGRGVMGAGSQAAPTTTPATTLASAVPGAPPQAAPTAPNPTDQRLAAGTQQAPGLNPFEFRAGLKLQAARNAFATRTCTGRQGLLPSIPRCVAGSTCGAAWQSLCGAFYGPPPLCLRSRRCALPVGRQAAQNDAVGQHRGAQHQAQAALGQRVGADVVVALVHQRL